MSVLWPAGPVEYQTVGGAELVMHKAIVIRATSGLIPNGVKSGIKQIKTIEAQNRPKTSNFFPDTKYYHGQLS